MLQNLQVVTACNAVGWFIKNYIPFIPNSLIPVSLAIIGIILNCVMSGQFTIEAAVIGLTSGLAAVGTYEGFKGLGKATAPKEQQK